MRSELRTHWRDPGYWRWLWDSRVSGDTKGAIALLVAVAFGIGGYLAAHSLAATRDAATIVTERPVTVVRTTRATAPPQVVTRSRTVTRTGETDVVTVRRDGRTVVVPAPGETVTVRRPGEQRIVTDPRTDTVVRTETSPATTETVTAQVPGPTQTVTQTSEVTVTDEVTVTEEVTEVVTVTVTVTEPDTTGD